MNLYEWKKGAGLEEIQQLAHDCETTAEYLRQIWGGHRLPSPKLAQKIAAATNNKVTVQDLRPDVYGEPD